MGRPANVFDDHFVEDKTMPIQREIARRFGIHRRTVMQIQNNETWRHVL